MRALVAGIGVVCGIILAVPAPASAQYNPYNQNQYNSQRYYGGGGSLNGYNYGTGSQWRNQYDSYGNSRGVDSRGNYWNYNRNTGTYYNYGTGEMRYGTGQNRQRIR